MFIGSPNDNAVEIVKKTFFLISFIFCGIVFEFNTYVLVNILNKTESAVFLFCRFSLFLNGPFFPYYLE